MKKKKLNAFIPIVQALFEQCGKGGLITTEKVNVMYYRPRQIMVNFTFRYHWSNTFNSSLYLYQITLPAVFSLHNDCFRLGLYP